MTAPLNEPRTPPYKLAGLVLTLLTIVAIVLVYFQFRGDFLPREKLTMMSDRSGLSMDPGAKATFNGVEIGKVGTVDQTTVGGQPRAKITLEVDPKYLKLIPKNVDAKINATTVFGNKYISFVAERPSPQRITSSDVIDASHVTTEFNTLFETVTSAEKVDPIKLNQTLSATAQALQGPRRAVRPVDHPRQRDPRRPEPEDAADPAGQPAAGRPRRRVCKRGT